MKIVRGVLELARKQGFILRNPAAVVGVPAGRSAEREAFDRDELRALLREGDSEWRTVILLGYCLGARLEDAAKMTWADVDLERGLIECTQRKTNRRVAVPIHPELEAHLGSMAGGVSGRGVGGALAPRLAQRAGRRDGNLSKQFARLMARAGIDRGEGKTPGGRSFPRKSFHALRHSFVSPLANAGVPEEVRLKLSGHAGGRVHTRYTHLQLAPLREAISRLPPLGMGEKPKHVDGRDSRRSKSARRESDAPGAGEEPGSRERG